MRKDIFQRTELLLGEDMMNALSRTKVIVFGVGVVGVLKVLSEQVSVILRL